MVVTAGHKRLQLLQLAASMISAGFILLVAVHQQYTVHGRPDRSTGRSLAACHGPTCPAADQVVYCAGTTLYLLGTAAHRTWHEGTLPAKQRPATCRSRPGWPQQCNAPTCLLSTPASIAAHHDVVLFGLLHRQSLAVTPSRTGSTRFVLLSLRTLCPSRYGGTYLHICRNAHDL